jgi:hypothetical protein
MIRKQIYIQSHQDNSLKKQVHYLGITEAEVIRRAIDRQMASIRFSIRDIKAWERERAFITKCVARGHAPGGRQWKREDAYGERLR